MNIHNNGQDALWTYQQKYIRKLSSIAIKQNVFLKSYNIMINRWYWFQNMIDDLVDQKVI